MASHMFYVTAEQKRAIGEIKTGFHYYTANTRKKVRKGDVVYFSHGGEFVLRAQVLDLADPPHDDKGQVIPGQAGFEWEEAA